MVAAAAIGAIGSIVGGLVGRRKAVSAGQNAFSHVDGIMRAANTFGFNPLTLLGAVAPMGGTPADNSAFGQGIANAAMIVADGIGAKPNNEAKLNAYQTANQRLQRKVTALSVRAAVPGLYGRARQPSDPEVYGGQPAGGVYKSGAVGDTSGAAGGPSPLADGQSVKPKDTEEISGFMKVRNKFAPDGFYVPGADGEPLDIWQLPVVAGAWAVDQGLRAWERHKMDRSSRRGMTYGVPLVGIGGNMPDRPYRLYGLPRDDSMRFRPMEPRKRQFIGVLGRMQ